MLIICNTEIAEQCEEFRLPTDYTILKHACMIQGFCYLWHILQCIKPKVNLLSSHTKELHFFGPRFRIITLYYSIILILSP